MPRHTAVRTAYAHAALITVAGAAMFTLPRHAAAQAYEGFAYAKSQLVDGLNGGTGWSSPWSAGFAASIGFATLSHASALPSVDYEARTNSDALLIRELKPHVGDVDGSDRAWMSFLFERDSETPASLQMDCITGDMLRVFIAPDGTVKLQYNGDPPDTSGKKASGSFVTDMFLLHVTGDGGGRIELWVNPSGTLGDPDASVAATGGNTYSNVKFGMSIAQTLDEIRTGSLEDVSTLSRPCRADCTHDRVLNINDSVCFQSEWKRKTAYGDYNADGVWNVNDFVAYQADFKKGCP